MSQQIGSVQIALKAVDEVSGVIGDIKGSISGLSGIATTLGTNMGSIGRIVGDLGGPFAGLGGIISGFATGGPAGAGIAMIGQGVDFLKGSVKAAEDSERVMTALKTAVENQGIAWGTVKDGIESTLKAMQTTSRFSDEELAEALKTLVQHGMDVKDAMNALPAAMDTAVGSGKPLSEIATAIGKAFEGQDTALTRLVPAIGDLDKNMGAGATSGDKFQAALGLLNDRFGGAALSDAQTFAGVQERMANAWDDFQETIGKAVLPALTDLLNGLMKIGTDAIGPLMDSLGELWSALFGDDVNLKDFGKFVMDNIIIVLKETARFIREDVVPTVKMFHEAFQTASDLIGPPLKTIGEAVNTFLGGLKTAFQGFYDWLVGGSLWTDMWNQMLTTASQLIGQLIGDLGSKLFDPMTKAFTTTIDAVKDLWGKGWDAIQTSAKTVWDTITTNVTPWIDGVKTIITTATDALKTTWGTNWQAIQTAAKTVWDAVTNAAGPWIDGVKTSIGTTMDGLKTAWETTWNGIQTGAQTVWDTITTNAGTWIDGVKTTIGTTTDAMKTAWDTSWQGVKTTLDTLLPQVQTFLNTKLDEMKNYLGTSTGTYGPTMTSALDGMQGAMNAGFLLVKGDWQGALDAISGSLTSWGTAAKGIMDGIMGQLQGAVNTGVDTMKIAFGSLVGAAQAAIAEAQRLFQQAQQAITGAAQQVVQTTNPATQAVTNAFDQTYDSVVSGADWLWQQLVGGSIWPDMMNTMQTMTSNAMTKIKSTVTSGFDEVAGMAASSLSRLIALQQKAAAAMMLAPTAANIQATYAVQQAVQAAQAAAAWTAPNVPAGAGTIPAGAGLEYVKAWEEAPANLSAFWVPETPQNLTGGDLASYAQTLADAIQASRVQSNTIPISVVVDGVTVSRVVEQRMISQRQIGGGY